MTILAHVTTVPESFRAISGQLRFMVTNGYAVHIVSSPGDELERLGREEGVQTHAVSMTRAITPARDLISLGRLVAVFRRIRPHIVHAHTPKAGLLALCAARLARVPVRIYHVRGLRFVTATGWKRHLLRRCEQLACSLANRVICVSPSVREVAVSEGLVKPDRIRVLLNGGHGTDASVRFNPTSLATNSRFSVRETWGIPQDAIVLGFVGRLVQDKGVRELAEAWIQLRVEYPHLHLLAVGPFEREDPIPKAVRSLFSSDARVHLTGQSWDTPPLYSAMDIVCLPTYREGLPKVPLEAAAMELPVVATRIPGCVDAIREDVTGLLVPSRDANELANAIRRYIENPTLRRQHALAGRQRVLTTFTQAAMWDAQLAEYEELLDRFLGDRKVGHFPGGTFQSPRRAA